MITYKEAKEIALNLNKKVNACFEYKAAYRFLDKDFDGEGDAGVIVLKDDGRAINWMAFIMNYHPEKDPKEIEF